MPEEMRIGWMSLSHNQVPNWNHAEEICKSWTKEEVRLLGSSRAALFAGVLIPDQLLEDLQIIRNHFEKISEAEKMPVSAMAEVSTDNDVLGPVISKVHLWDHDVYVAEDSSEVVLSMSRLHVVGALHAAGFHDEF